MFFFWYRLTRVVLDKQPLNGLFKLLLLLFNRLFAVCELEGRAISMSCKVLTHDALMGSVLQRRIIDTCRALLVTRVGAAVVEITCNGAVLSWFRRILCRGQFRRDILQRVHRHASRLCCSGLSSYPSKDIRKKDVLLSFCLHLRARKRATHGENRSERLSGRRTPWQEPWPRELARHRRQVL